MPDDDELHQPHDKLFKASFSDPVNAAAFLRWQLPQAVAGAIDWETLRLESGSFVDSHYRHSESDLLFSAACGESKCCIYLLFEHLSTPDSALGLRLLRYMVRIWESGLADGVPQARLPVIVPVVLVQHARKWEISPCFSVLFDLPKGLADELRPFIPEFAFGLVQLAELPFAAICGTPAGILTLRVMKAEREGTLLGDEVWDEDLMMKVSREAFELVIRYLLGGEIDNAAFEDRLKKILQPQLQRTVMSLADQLIEKGIEKGIQKGVEKGQKAAILEALLIRFGELPEGVRESVEAIQDGARLNEVYRSAIRSTTLSEFVALL
jgi:predicted transposase/invertase (TIGR01784 family)